MQDLIAYDHFSGVDMNQRGQYLVVLPAKQPGGLSIEAAFSAIVDQEWCQSMVPAELRKLELPRGSEAFIIMLTPQAVAMKMEVAARVALALGRRLNAKKPKEEGKSRKKRGKKSKGK